jgi:uncharacterized protein DUF6157
MNYYDTLIEVADDCPTGKALVPQARGGKKTKAVVKYEILVKQPYTHTEEDIAFETYAALHDIPKDIWSKELKKFLGRGHPHLRVSPLAKRYGWGIHNKVAGKIALIAIESSRYKQLLDDPHTTKVKAFRSTRA